MGFPYIYLSLPPCRCPPFLLGLDPSDSVVESQHVVVSSIPLFRGSIHMFDHLCWFNPLFQSILAGQILIQCKSFLNSYNKSILPFCWWHPSIVSRPRWAPSRPEARRRLGCLPNHRHRRRWHLLVKGVKLGNQWEFINGSVNQPTNGSRN